MAGAGARARARAGGRPSPRYVRSVHEQCPGRPPQHWMMYLLVVRSSTKLWPEEGKTRSDSRAISARFIAKGGVEVAPGLCRPERASDSGVAFIRHSPSAESLSREGGGKHQTTTTTTTTTTTIKSEKN